LEIDAELGDELDSQLGVVDRVDRTDDFLGVPGGADFAFRIAGLEQSDQLRVRCVVEAFVGERHQLAAPIERIGLSTTMPAGLVLHPPPDLVEHEVRELHDMEWGRRQAASCRTPTDTDPTDPTSPKGSEPSNRQAAQRTICNSSQRHGQARHRGVGLGRRRRPGSTTTGV
jgi:hypothetical protein